MRLVLEKHIEPHIIDFYNELNKKSDIGDDLYYHHNLLILYLQTDEVDLNEIYKYFEHLSSAFKNVIINPNNYTDAERAFVLNIDRKYKLEKLLNK